MNRALSAPHKLGFSYSRSTGGAVRLFLAGLAAAEIWGSSDANGAVTVPPVDWDPATGRPVERFVRLAERGVVRSWTWVSQPLPRHQMTKPFALALVQLDGADTSLLHLVDVAGEAEMSTGMAVRAEWARRRTGSISDIRAFVPAGVATDPGDPGEDGTGGPPDTIEVRTDVQLGYRFHPGLAASRFLSGLAEGRIEGGRCPVCGAVYVPPRSRCPACRRGPLEAHPLGDRGSVVTYTVIHIPAPGLETELPFIVAWIRLDGADTPFAHLLRDLDPDELRPGLRVEAVWVEAGSRRPGWESISHFRPTGADAGSRA